MVPGNLTTNPALIDQGFPLSCPKWDYHTGEGKERLKVYCQILMGGICATAKWTTNLVKFTNVQQEKNDSVSAFLERLMEDFRAYTMKDPEMPTNRLMMTITFVNQAALDKRCKLQKIDEMADKSLQDLLKMGQNLYNNRETPEESQTRIIVSKNAKQTRNVAKILLAVTLGSPGEKRRQLRYLTHDPDPDKECPLLQKDQCT